MTKVYALTGESGAYSDMSWWIEGIYQTREAAVEARQIREQELEMLMRADRNKEYNTYIDPQGIVRGLSPAGTYDYSSCRWEVEELELRHVPERLIPEGWKP